MLLGGLAHAEAIPAPCAAMSLQSDDPDRDLDPRELTSDEQRALARIDASLDAGAARDPAGARLERALIYFDADHFVDAAQHYCEVVVRHPRSKTAVRALIYLSQTLMKLGSYGEIVPTVKKLCTSLRKNGEATAFCGDALL